MDAGARMKAFNPPKHHDTLCNFVKLWKGHYYEEKSKDNDRTATLSGTSIPADSAASAAGEGQPPTEVLEAAALQGGAPTAEVLPPFHCKELPISADAKMLRGQCDRCCCLWKDASVTRMMAPLFTHDTLCVGNS